MDLEHIFNYIREPAELGNIAVSVRRCVEKINQAHPVLKDRLCLELSELIEKFCKTLTSNEIEKIKQIISSYPEVKDKLSPLSRKLTTIKASLPAKIGLPGKVNCLLVVNNAYGCLIDLQATPQQGQGKGIIVVNPYADPVINRALFSANIAISNYLASKGLNARGQGLYSTYDIPVELGKISKKYEGNSIGLAGAISILSYLLNKPVPSNFAFTGYVSISGEIKGVGGINTKLEVAYDKEITKVFIPLENKNQVSREYSRIIRPASKLDEVIEEVFSPKDIKRLIQQMNGSGVQAALGSERFMSKVGKGKKILISCVGNRDPYAPPDKEGKVSEGPILTAFKKVNPEIVYLLVTKEFKKYGEETKKELEIMMPKGRCEVRLDVLDLGDPTVYDDLIFEMGDKIRNFLKTMGEDLEKYVVISSGTPQMHVVWVYLLTKETMLSNACVLQVREPRFVKRGEERVREVISGYLGIGRK